MTDLAQLITRAETALQQGRIDDGIVAYRELLALDAGSADAWYNLGYLFRCARRFDEALDAYAEALTRGIERPEEVRLNRAVILSEFCDRDVDAETELRAALAVAPRFVTAWLNLGNLYEDRGDPVQALAAYRAALAIDPRNERALARTAIIDVAQGKAGAAVHRLRSALADPRLANAAEPAFALGTALDAQGAYDEAFAVYARANAAAMASSSTRYDRVAHEQLIDRLIALPPAPAPSGEVAVDGPPPLFICGMFRSGSTLVEQILSRHPRVTAGGEIAIIPAMAAGLRPYPEAMAGAWPAALREEYRRATRTLYPDADILTDKRPDNFLHIGLIKRLFPDAKIVHTVRAPLDTILSVWFLYFDDSIAYGHRLDDIAHWFGQYRRLMTHWQALYPDDIYAVAYEDVVRDPRPTISALLDFCSLDWEERVLSPQDAGGKVRTASAWQVRAPLHQRSSGRWRHYAAHLDEIRAILGLDYV